MRVVAWTLEGGTRTHWGEMEAQGCDSNGSERVEVSERFLPARGAHNGASHGGVECSSRNPKVGSESGMAGGSVPDGGFRQLNHCQGIARPPG